MLHNHLKLRTAMRNHLSDFSYTLKHISDIRSFGLFSNTKHSSNMIDYNLINEDSEVFIKLVNMDSRPKHNLTPFVVFFSFKESDLPTLLDGGKITFSIDEPFSDLIQEEMSLDHFLTTLSTIVKKLKTTKNINLLKII